MPTVEEIAREIVAREGGYVNDPDDPGGATNYGVTLATMRTLRMDVNGDSQVNESDVRSLTRAQAEKIFVEHYFNKPRLAELPSMLQPSVFDMYVNAGRNAVKILQRLLIRMGFSLAVDGILGPVTIAATLNAAEIAPEHLADAYGVERRNYYYALADQRVQSRKYACTRNGGKGGWITRAETFIASKYHLTAVQHKARVGSWG